MGDPVTMMMIKALVAVLALSLCVAVCYGENNGHGWHDSVEWKTWSEAKEEAAASGKPIMVILHKSWCGACKRLRPTVAESASFAELAKNFVMVSAEDDESPHEDPTFQIDGGYIPRVFFTGSDASPVASLYNEDGNDKSRYFYPHVSQLEQSMQRAVEHFQ